MADWVRTGEGVTSGLSNLTEDELARKADSVVGN